MKKLLTPEIKLGIPYINLGVLKITTEEVFWDNKPDWVRLNFYGSTYTTCDIEFEVKIDETQLQTWKNQYSDENEMKEDISLFLKQEVIRYLLNLAVIHVNGKQKQIMDMFTQPVSWAGMLQSEETDFDGELWKIKSRSSLQIGHNS